MVVRRRYSASFSGYKCASIRSGGSGCLESSLLSFEFSFRRADGIDERLAGERRSFKAIMLDGYRNRSAISATKTLEVDHKRSRAHRV